MVYLWEYDWPGNVRQLENVVEQLVILSSKDRIDVADLPATIIARKTSVEAPALPLLAAEGLDLQDTLEQLEFRLIEEALKLAKGKKSVAAELLRVKRTTLVAKLRRRKAAQAAPQPPRLYALPQDAEEAEAKRSARALLRRAQYS
jgi:DNA-binding NtrC family response regulator